MLITQEGKALASTIYKWRKNFLGTCNVKKANVTSNLTKIFVLNIGMSIQVNCSRGIELLSIYLKS